MWYTWLTDFTTAIVTALTNTGVAGRVLSTEEFKAALREQSPGRGTCTDFFLISPPLEKKFRSNRESNAVHRMYEPDILTARPAAPRGRTELMKRHVYDCPAGQGLKFPMPKHFLFPGDYCKFKIKKKKNNPCCSRLFQYITHTLTHIIHVYCTMQSSDLHLRHHDVLLLVFIII